MAIMADIILMWGGTNATIPTGWTRVTALDGKFPKAWGAVASNTAGGSATHTHTSSAHSHTAAAHTHTGGSSSNGDSEDGGGSDPTFAAASGHAHSFSITGVTGGALSDAVTYPAVTTNVPYYEVIFIKPSGAAANITTGILAHYSGDSDPVLWYKCDGNNGTPNLTNKYLKGAAAAGNAGGSSTTDTHAHSLNHTHSNVSHTSTGTASYDGGVYGRYPATPGSGGGAVVSAAHGHAVSLASVSEASSAYTGSVTSGAIDLGYKKLKVIQSAGSRIVEGLIAMYLSDTAPLNWVLCNGSNGTLDLRDKFIKITNTYSEVGTTGGSNTHTHAASNSHTHTANGTHTHASGTLAGVSETGVTGSGGPSESRGHSHTVTSQSSSTSSWGATTIAGDSADHQPANLTVSYIQLDKVSVGGAFILGLM